MSRQAQALLSLLLLATCAATGLADAPPPPFSTIPGLFPPGIPGLSSPISPGPACCKALVEVDENCLRKLFPLFPSIPAVLKSSCATAAAPKAARSKQ
ncbi:hypothetical protein ACFX1S_024927 [Malus domestica]